MDANKKNNRKRKITMWLGSYLLVAVILIFYFKIPFVPLILGGLLALVITWRSNL